MTHIAIIAPSFEGDGDSPQIALDWIKSHGWQGHNFLPPQGSHPVFAAPQDQRLTYLLKAIEDPEINILWAIRGGGGSTLLVPELLKRKDILMKRSTPLTLMGFSDITALHVAGHQELNWRCVHTPTLKSIFRTDPKSLDLLVHLIQHKTVRWEAPLTPLNHAAEVMPSTNEPLVGGNLSLINLSIGSPWMIKPQGSFLVLEDVGEQPYRLALKLAHLTQAGVLKDVKALVMGDFSANPDELMDFDLITLVLKEFAHSIDIPVFSGVPIGHDALNHPFAQGSRAHISTDGIFSVEVNLP